MEQTKNITVIPARRRVGNTAKESEIPKLRVAAYCRVSTDSDEQATSYEAQVEHYTDYIRKNPEWELAGIFADDGISGTNTKKREEFNRMIDEAMAGKIDMIVTKSISRFARNTLDCLKYIRQLKEKNIPVYFEKENINTMDAKGEVLLKQNLTLGIHRIDVFFFEVHGDVLFLKLSDVFQAVQSVSCKTADGLGHNHVDFSRHCLINHAIELFTLFRVRAGYSIVSKYPGKLPFRVLADIIGVMLHLCLVTGGLLITVRGNTAVSSHTEFWYFGFLCRIADTSSCRNHGNILSLFHSFQPRFLSDCKHIPLARMGHRIPLSVDPL